MTDVFGRVAFDVLTVLWFLLWARLLLSYAFALFRWRPAGAAAATVEVVLSATDWLVRPLNRFLPPLRIGRVTLALGLIIALLAVARLRLDARFW